MVTACAPRVDARRAPSPAELGDQRRGVHCACNGGRRSWARSTRACVDGRSGRHARRSQRVAARRASPPPRRPRHARRVRGGVRRRRRVGYRSRRAEHLPREVLARPGGRLASDARSAAADGRRGHHAAARVVPPRQLRRTVDDVPPRARGATAVAVDPHRLPAARRAEETAPGRREPADERITPYDMGDALAATLAATPSTKSRQRKPEPTPALVVHQRSSIARAARTRRPRSVSPASVSYQPRSATSACGAAGPRSAFEHAPRRRPTWRRGRGPPSRR